MKLRYIVDIDNTICNTVNSDYHNSKPWHDRIEKINNLYNEGHHIVYWTARGGTSGLDWTDLTTKQLTEWGCKFHELKLGKPSYEIWIDDKAINSEEFFK